MGRDDWYRTSRWDPPARAAFERGLAREKPEERGEVMRIKATMLLHSRVPGRQKAGVALLHRVLEEQAGDAFDVAGAHAALAEHHERAGRPQQALVHHRAARAAEQADGVISHDTEMKLAALLVEVGDGADLDEAAGLLTARFAEGLIDGDEQWRCCVARARLAARQGAAPEAALYARVALWVRASDGPVYAHHEGVGRVAPAPGEVREMKRLAGAADPRASDPRIAEHWRGEYDWALLERLAATPEELAAEAAFEREAGRVVDELRAAGLAVGDLHELAARTFGPAADLRRAEAVLLPWLGRAESPLVKGLIAEALADTRARKRATGPLLELFAGLPDGDVKESVARALSTLARDEHLGALAELIRDPVHGRYRDYLFWALAYCKRPEAVDLALEMLDDPEMGMPALYALSDMKSERARPVLERLAAAPLPPRRRTRDPEDPHDLRGTRVKVAKRALEKLDKARAGGRARP
ncbi:MAG TPA: HEAT repeat domain-containing protein [Solirubrobacteraceae bacterium]|jgi:hypothetical protein